MTTDFSRKRECLTCHHRWTAPVVLSKYTTNLSGEANVFCPRCKSGAVMSHPATKTLPYVIAITYWNGHVNRDHSFDSYSAAMNYVCSSISYSGGRIHRVVLEENGNGRTALWDTTWDAVSKAAGTRRKYQ